MDQNIYKQWNRTQKEQDEVHAAIVRIYEEYDMLFSGVKFTDPPKEILENKYYDFYKLITDSTQILTLKHSAYALRKLESIGPSIMGLDVGQPWFIYWNLHVLDLLQIHNYDKYNPGIIKLIAYCQNQNGGFGGGHMQISHLAPTYSAILSLLIVGTPEAFECINREKLQQWFYSIRNPEYKGSYLMHQNGESDMRAVYIVVIMTILLKLDPILLEDCAEYIARCQTYEGGIGAIPFAEAHGGYTFCGYAALVAMKQTHVVDRTQLLYWLIQRQMVDEGGFNGRTNKVVDSCYTFWQASVFELLRISTEDFASYNGDLLLNTEELQNYVKICQNEKSGGLFDKPGKSPDSYHTCYSLSGYSATQPKDEAILKRINPIFNITAEKYAKALEYFSQKEILKLDINNQK